MENNLMLKEIYPFIKVLKQSEIIFNPSDGLLQLIYLPFNEVVVLMLLKNKKRSMIKGIILIKIISQQTKDLNLTTCEVIRPKNKLTDNDYVFSATRKVLG
jgi:hypothetical protein